MRNRDLNKLLQSLSQLTPSQSQQVLQQLTQEETRRTSFRLLEQAAGSPACRHCASKHVVKNGCPRGLQRWLCRDCNRTYNATTGSPLSHLRHKEKFALYAECMAGGMTLRVAAKTVGICLDTAFRWRHRFLEEVAAHQPKAVSGLVELDETYFPFSRKGTKTFGDEARARGGAFENSSLRSKNWVPVLVGRARGQAFTMDSVLKRMDGIEVAAALRGVVKAGEALLCTDGHSAFLKLGKTLGVTVKSFVASYHRHVKDKVFHVQSVNSYHERLKTWILRDLRGVATKYLPHYLGWQRLKTWRRSGATLEEIIVSALGRQVINL